jgi:hypothetical protein
MRYRLSTLLILMTIGPPLIAVIWYAWWVLLSFVLVVAVGTAYVVVSYLLARLVAGLIASVMS